MTKDSISDTLSYYWVEGVLVSGFGTCDTIVIIYHYLVYLVVPISISVIAHYIVGTIRIDLPFRDELNEVFKGY
jgi:hypothetical protein